MPATLFGLLRYYLRHRRGTVALLGALLLASTGAQALTPLIVRHVIDSAMTGAALADLVWWGAAYGGAATLAFAITVVATLSASSTSSSNPNIILGSYPGCPPCELS